MTNERYIHLNSREKKVARYIHRRFKKPAVLLDRSSYTTLYAYLYISGNYFVQY
ncbi:hypothetical protein RchiOBHm_Chr7g0197621 [Rosa chinensis]|uniref:Uncharacterized protein n=1 Tax=Rosa chinensis TaxID=74649 RepID=A0A2P6P6Y6_ROSCH|nr:hypothetical protein RchiOBHm_Chr7g0197621 [Rosa chinensis]